MSVDREHDLRCEAEWVPGAFAWTGCGCDDRAADGDVECAYACGRRATTPWGSCGSCENEATSRDAA